MNLSLRSIRKNLAALSLLALIASFLVVAAVANAEYRGYQDVNGDEWYVSQGHLDWGLDNGVLDSSQVNFRPGDSSTRGEFFTMTARANGLAEATCDVNLAPDLNANHWECGWVTAMAEAGIVSGDGSDAPVPGAMRPRDNVKRAEAAKVAVETFELTGTTLGSEWWTDSEADEWYDAYMGVAHDNCVFQGVGGGNTVEPGRDIVRAEAIAVIHRATEPTDECIGVVTTGALTVAIDGTTPASQNIPLNGNSIVYSIFNLSASADEDINIEELTITRNGLGLPGDFSAIRLYVNGVQVGSDKTINTSTNSATFALSGNPIVVPAGSSVLLEVRGSMDAAENSENSLCIEVPEDVLAIGDDSNTQVGVGGSFAVCGNLMTTTSAAVGEITYTTTDYTGNINVGDLDVSMTKLRLENDNVEDADLERVTFKQTGSADGEDFANPALYVSGVQVADSSVASWEGDFLTFDLSDDPLFIERGNSKNLELRIDVVGGIGSTAAFDIYRDWHIEAIGRVYHYGMNVVEDAGSTAPVARDIEGGRLAFALSSNNPTVGDVAPGANDHEFLAFNISTAGEAVSINGFSLYANYDGVLGDENDIEDLKVWGKNSLDEWVVVAGPLEPSAGTCAAGTCTVDFTDSFDVPASTTKEYRITMDLVNGAPEGAVFSVDFPVATEGVEAEYSNGDPVAVADISGGDLTGQDQTVNPPSIDIEVASTPADQSVVNNQQDVSFAGFNFTASSADDLLVTSVTFTCNEVAVTGDCDDYLSNVSLYLKEGSTLTLLDGPESVVGGAIVFNNVTLDIEAGNTARLVVRGNVSSSPTATDQISIDLADEDDVSVEDSEGNALTADNAGADEDIQLCEAGAGVDEGCTSDDSAPLQETPIVTFESNGGIIVSIDADTPLDDLVLDGTSDLLVSKLHFEADDLEDVKIRKLRLTNNGDDSAAASVILSDGTTEKTGSLVGGVASFEGLNYIVPRNGDLVLDVLVDTNEIGAGGADSGDDINLYVDDLEGDDYATNLDIEAVGVSSGILLDGGLGVATSADCAPTDVGAETNFICVSSGYDDTLDMYDAVADEVGTLTVRNNIPTITLADETTSIYGAGKVPSGNQALLMFEVAVEGDGTAELDTLDLDINVSGTCAGLPANLDLDLYEKGNSTAIANDGGTVDGIFDEATDDEFTGSSGVRVAAGTSKTYIVRGDTATDGCVTGDSISLDLVNFVWDDGEAGLVIDTTGVDTMPLYGSGIAFGT